MAADTHACGDSLYRVGKGISFRVYTAPLPGSVPKITSSRFSSGGWWA